MRHTSLRYISRAVAGTVVAFAVFGLVACGGGGGHKKQTSENVAPTAAFTASSAKGLAPLTVQFDASGSHDPEGAVASYAWTFDDGGTDSGATVQHTFTTPGRYVIDLVVTDGAGKTGTTNHTVITMSPVAASHYVVAEIPKLAGWCLEPTAINNRGEVTGWGCVDSSEAAHAFLYSGGVTKDLGVIGENSYARDINDGGDVVGVANYDAEGGPRAFVYRNGAMHDLGSFGGYGAEATGINEAGQIVGRLDETDGHVRAFLYENGTIKLIGDTSIDFAMAGCIADDGSIAGAVSTATGVHAFLYVSGTTTDLGTLGGHSAWVQECNAAGDVIGYSDTASGGYHGFLYRDGVMGEMDLGFHEPNAINEAGVVVGNDIYGPVIWDAVNGEQSLDALIGPDTGYVIDIAADINDVGQIVARGTRLSDSAVVVLVLTPAPAD